MMERTGHCRDCCYWEPNLPEGYGVCGRTIMEAGQPRDGPSLAIAQDGYEYHAWLRTWPNFGCVQFEPGVFLSVEELAQFTTRESE